MTGRNWIERFCDERQALSRELDTATGTLMRLRVEYQIARGRGSSNLYDLLMRISVAGECKKEAERILQKHIKQHRCQS